MFRQEKGEKKPTQGALCVALPRAESVPLCIPRRTIDSAEHLNLHPEHDKNVPIFAVQGFCFWNSAGRRERSRRHQQGRGDVPSRRENVTQFFRCVRVGYTGEVVLRAANRNMSLAGGKRSIVYAICRAAGRHECLPCADFFGYFLVRKQESNIWRLLYQHDRHQFHSSQRWVFRGYSPCSTTYWVISAEKHPTSCVSTDFVRIWWYYVASGSGTK